MYLKEIMAMDQASSPVIIYLPLKKFLHSAAIVDGFSSNAFKLTIFNSLEALFFLDALEIE